MAWGVHAHDYSWSQTCLLPTVYWPGLCGCWLDILQWAAWLLPLTISSLLFLLTSESPSYRDKEIRRRSWAQGNPHVPVLVSELTHGPISIFSETVFKVLWAWKLRRQSNVGLHRVTSKRCCKDSCLLIHHRAYHLQISPSQGRAPDCNKLISKGCSNTDGRKEGRKRGREGGREGEGRN